MSASNSLAVLAKVDNPLAFASQMAKPIASLLNCNEAQGEAAALTCLQEGLTPIDFVRRYHLIQGKPVMRADAMLAELRLNHGGDFKIVERSPERAAIVITRGDQSFEAEFTWEEAQQSRWPWKNWQDHDKGLKDNWATPTDRKSMLWARLVSDTLRAFIPELCSGVYTPEEMGDVIDSTATVVSSVPMSATEFREQQAEPVEGEVVDAVVVNDAPFEQAAQVAPAETESRLIASVRDLFERAFGEKSPDAMDAALKSRGAQTLHNLTDEQLAELRDKLTAKASAGN